MSKSTKSKNSKPVKKSVKAAPAKKSAVASKQIKTEGHTHLKPGMKAPAFKGVDQHGKALRLADFKGKKLALYFYPRDMTPTCTVQACNLRDDFSLLRKKGIAVLGVSIDDAKRHQSFIEKHQLPFSLLADPDAVVLQQYGVWGEKMFMGKKIIGTHRTTFLIDEQGLIAHILHKPNSKDHAKEIIAAWEAIK